MCLTCSLCFMCHMYQYIFMCFCGICVLCAFVLYVPHVMYVTGVVNYRFILCIFFLSKVYLTLSGLASLHEIEMTKRNRFMSMGMAGRHPGGFRLQGTLPWRRSSCTARGRRPRPPQCCARTCLA